MLWCYKLEMSKIKHLLFQQQKEKKKKKRETMQTTHTHKKEQTNLTENRVERKKNPK